MEGYFWRFTQRDSCAVVVVLVGVLDGWGLVGVAAHPGGRVHWETSGSVGVDPEGLGLRVGGLTATPDRLRLDLDGVWGDLHITPTMPWPHRAFGGIGPAQMVPGLSQYWHPHLLDGRVMGGLTFHGDSVALDGARVYAEKNWGAGGFPDRWWWGQAHGFEREDVCVAFAGGRAGLGPVKLLATSLVVRVGDDVIRVVRPPAPITLDVGEGGWRLRARTPRYAITLEGHANGTTPHALPVPVPGGEVRDGLARQHLAGAVGLRVRRGRRTLFRGTSLLAGLEAGGVP